MTKQHVLVTKVYGISFDGMTVDDAIEYLTKLSEGLKDPYLYEDPYGYDGAYELCLGHSRLETDAEYEARLKREHLYSIKEKEARRKKKEKEREEYERLKKKFEKR